MRRRDADHALARSFSRCGLHVAQAKYNFEVASARITRAVNAPPVQPDPKSLEAAIEEFVALHKSGDRTDSSQFVGRYPELAPDLESALEASLTLENMTASHDDNDELPGQIGPFRVVCEIGRGGMGVVLEAVEEPLGRRVALKVLPAELLTSRSAQEICSWVIPRSISRWRAQSNVAFRR